MSVSKFVLDLGGQSEVSLPSECNVPSSNWGCTLRLAIHTDCGSRLISRPDVSTSCELAAVTYPANFCGFSRENPQKTQKLISLHSALRFHEQNRARQLSQVTLVF